MRDGPIGIEFSPNMRPFYGFGNQNDHNTSFVIAQVLDIHLEEPFPLFNEPASGEDAIVDLRDRMRSFTELEAPVTVLLEEEVPMVIELLGAALERLRVSSEENTVINPLLREIPIGATRKIAEALRVYAGEVPAP